MSPLRSLSLLVVCLAVLELGGAAHGAVTQANGLIAYVRADSAPSWVWVVRPDGGGRHALVQSGDRAAAYLSSYFVRGNGSKATLQDNARNPHLPRMLIWVSPTLTRPTGVSMRNLRRCRQLGLCGWAYFLRRTGRRSSSRGWSSSLGRGPFAARDVRAREDHPRG